MAEGETTDQSAIVRDAEAWVEDRKTNDRPVQFEAELLIFVLHRDLGWQRV